jgi:hypothetical protein
MTADTAVLSIASDQVLDEAGQHSSHTVGDVVALLELVRRNAGLAPRRPEPHSDFAVR